MKTLMTAGVAIVAASLGMAAVADSSFQPPMNNLNFAYYTCDNSGAFLVEYDANTPKNATMTTSNDNKRYGLKRTSVDEGVEFSGGGATFWTDGKTVRVEGTTKTLKNCKFKPG